ncbi:hypothetical protein [Streptomyces mangrovisoli]|nr:hypothetical protein [Streptomyces mangrovisoli]
MTDVGVLGVLLGQQGVLLMKGVLLVKGVPMKGVPMKAGGQGLPA